jgi:hypothetical protein
VSRTCEPLEERFWPNVDISGDCWLWKGPDFIGYGQISRDGKLTGVHRVSYEKYIGPIPEGYEIDHMCHTKNCVYPFHLRAVTSKQNAENRRGARRDSRSGVQGVSWSSRKRKWRVFVTSFGKRTYGGEYGTLAEAEQRAMDLRNELFTHNDADRKSA